MAALTRELELEAGTDPVRPYGGEDVGVSALLRLRDRMKQQLMEYSAAINSGQPNIPDHIIEDKFIQSAKQDLQGDIEDLEVSFWHKTLALQRIQLTDALRSNANQDDNDSRPILETLNHIVLLSQKIIKTQKQVREKEQQLIDIKRKRLSLKKEKGQKLQGIQAIIQKQKNEEASMNLDKTKMNENFEKESEMTAVIQNVFQNIIIGSRINWAEDPSLKAIVLQFEKKVQLQ